MNQIMFALRVMCACAIVAGVFFRIHNIDRKVYGVDEAVTSLRVAGATLPDFRSALVSGKLHSLAAVRERYQQARPRTTFATTVESLERDDPQHPPLYFVMQRIWQTFGTSVAACRSLSVIIGLILLVAVFWLASELFDRDVGLVATALVAVSPFHVAYAQYNREYALWALVTATSSALILVSLRRGRAVTWVAYAASATLGLYTDPLFLCVVTAHAAYACDMLVSRKVDARQVVFFAVALVSAVVAYVPWLMVLWNGRHVIETTTQWYAVPLPAKLLAGKWFFEIASVFFDAEYGNLRLSAVAVIVVACAFALAFIGIRSSSRRRAAFMVYLVGASAVPLIVADLVLHQSRSTAGRYLSPAWLGLELAVAAGLLALLRSKSFTARRGGVAFAALIVVAGIASLAASSSRTSWWVDSHDGPLVGISRALSTKHAADLCFVDDYESVLVLSDSVAEPVNLSRSYLPGCLAVANDSEIRNVALTSGKFAKVSTASAGTDAGMTELHRETGSAHRIAFEEVALWQLLKDGE